MNKFYNVLLKILLFPFGIITFFSLIYFKKKGMLNFNIIDAIDKLVEDMKKL